MLGEERSLLEIFYASSSGLAIYLLGGMDNLFIGFCLFMLIDYLTGCIKALKTGKMRRQAMVDGGLKKFVQFLIVIVANYLDIMFHTSDYFINARFITLAFYIGLETISIIENAEAVGVKIPPKLRKAIQIYNEKQEDTNDVKLGTQQENTEKIEG